MEKLNKIEHPDSKFYKFADGNFSFWEVNLGKQKIIFRVREDDDVEKRAKEKGINIPPGTPIYEASDESIKIWLDQHPSYPIIEE